MRRRVPREVMRVVRGIDHDLDRRDEVGRRRGGPAHLAAFFAARGRPRGRKLPIWLRRIVDGDELANSAMCSVIMGLREGRFQDLHDRDDLWALLAFDHRPQGV